MVRKGFCFAFIFVIVFLLISCSTENHSHNDGVSYDDYLSDLKDVTVFKYREYVFYSLNKSEFCVAEFENLNLMKEMSFNYHEVSNEDYNKIQRGMSVFDVVALLGLPIKSSTSGISSLDFESATGDIYRIQWDAYMKVVDKTIEQ